MANPVLAKTVLLSVKDGEWDKWGERFVARQPFQRVQNLVPPNVDAVKAKDLIVKAITDAGPGGTLIVSVGHGGVVSSRGRPEEGRFELAPNGALTIGGRDVKNTFVDVFYDVKLTREGVSDLEHDLKQTPPPPRLARFRIYQEISAAFKTKGLQRVVLLTCNVGNAPEFLRKVANDWGVVIQAYLRKVGINTFQPNGSFVGQKPTIIVDFENILLNTKTLAHVVIDQEEQLPFDRSVMVFIGPPLP